MTLKDYMGLQKRSWQWTFRKDAYKTWWSVPLRERLRFGTAIAVVMWVIVPLIIIFRNYPLFWILYIATLFLVFIPVYQINVEKIVAKHAKNNLLKEK